MKRVLAAVLFLGVLASSYATIARIESMGKYDNFFMDETSVYRNPANVSIYPNMLMGSYGEYNVIPSDTATRYSTTVHTTYSSSNGAPISYDTVKTVVPASPASRDPRDPFFGGILSYSLKQSANEGNQYPMISMGAVFNRHDNALNYLTRDPTLYGDRVLNANINFADPVGKIDFMLGYAFPNGGMIGVGTYLAFQQQSANGTVNMESSVYRGTAGLNWPVAKSMDLEASVGGQVLTFIGDSVGGDGSDNKVTLAKNDVGIQGDVRLFSALTTLNGDFVPHLGVKYQELASGGTSLVDVAGGLGLNVNIDKGFFWAGLECLYDAHDIKLATDSNTQGIGGRVGFGIERNVFWDWFVIRVGVTKSIMYITTGENSGYWSQNPEQDDPDNDIAGLGFGINVENRLKFDLLLAKDIQNTFTNLLSGPQHHIVTRIDATFSF